MSDRTKLKVIKLLVGISGGRTRVVCEFVRDLPQDSEDGVWILRGWSPVTKRLRVATAEAERSYEDALDATLDGDTTGRTRTWSMSEGGFKEFYLDAAAATARRAHSVYVEGGRVHFVDPDGVVRFKPRRETVDAALDKWHAAGQREIEWRMLRRALGR